MELSHLACPHSFALSPSLLKDVESIGTCPLASYIHVMVPLTRYTFGGATAVATRQFKLM